MGIRRLLLLPALLSVAQFAQSGGEVNVWTSRGPEGGIVGRAVIDPRNPDRLYAIAGGRLYQTTDAARHWSVLGAPDVTVLAVDPQNSNTLYGANNSALFKSTDNGLTWNPSGAGVPCPCTNLASLAIDPGDASVLYAAYGGTSGEVSGGLFKSMDGGATWSAASAGLPVFQLTGGRPYSGIRSLAIDPGNPSTLYAAMGLILSAGGGLFKSTDGAASWNPVNSGLPDNFFARSLAIDPRNPNTLFVSSETANSIFKSTDGGASWAIVSSVLGMQDLVVDPQDSATIYGVSSRGVVKSMDKGASWNVVLPEVTINSGTPWLAVTPQEGGASTVYAGGTGRGVLKSTDGGSNWATANSGLIGTWIDSLAIDAQNPGTLYAGVSGVGLFKSADGAASWSTTPVLAGQVFALAIYPSNAGILYASTSNGVQKSPDGGQSWVQLPLDTRYETIFGLAIDAQNPGAIYAGGFRSLDGGADWTKLTGFTGSLTALATDPQNSGTLYAGSMTGAEQGHVSSISSGVLKSVDGGETWSRASSLWQSVTVATAAVDPKNSSVVYAQTANLDCDYYFCDGLYSGPDVLQGRGLFKSADGGATWVKLKLPGNLSYVSLLGIDQQGTVYVRGQGGLVSSRDGGTTWNALPTAGLSSLVNVLAFDPRNPNHLFVGTYWAGVFEITLTPGQP